jgi:hypothetical protein
MSLTLAVTLRGNAAASRILESPLDFCAALISQCRSRSEKRASEAEGQPVVKAIRTMVESQLQVAFDRSHADLQTFRDLASRFPLHRDAAKYLARPLRQLCEGAFESLDFGARLGNSCRSGPSSQTSRSASISEALT